jgi:hypothetical protein
MVLPGAQVGKTQVGKAQVGKAQVGKTQVGKTQVGKTQVGKTRRLKAYFDRIVPSLSRLPPFWILFAISDTVCHFGYCMSPQFCEY